MSERLPEEVFFAGPNASGKSTVTDGFAVKGKYINADDIKRVLGCDDLEAAQKAETFREECVAQKMDFTFETVMSTDRNLNLLKKAKKTGFFVKGTYVITCDPAINIARVKHRALNGKHNVPTDKVVSRYKKSLDLLPEVLNICDVCNIYDNSDAQPVRIFKKRKNVYFFQETDFWKKKGIARLTGILEEKLLPMTMLHA